MNSDFIVRRPGICWFAAFVAAFAVLAGVVFWGTWSPDFAPIMPDDCITHSMFYGDHLNRALREFIADGHLMPSDLFWKGLLVSPYFCQELKYAASMFVCALGMAFFLRGRGLSRLASYGAGLLLAFCGYWSTLFSAGHGGWFIAASYATFLFGFSDRAVRTNALRHWLLLGLFAGWSLLSQSDFCFIMAILAIGYFIWACIRERKFPLRGMIAAAVVTAAVGAPGFKSALVAKEIREDQIKKGDTVAGANDAGAGMDERKKRWIFVTNWSLPADEIAEFFSPRLNGDTSCPLTLSVGASRGTGVRPYTGALGRPIDAKTGNYRQHSLYVGRVTCILALLAIVLATIGRKKGKNGDMWFFLAAAIFFCLLSLGRNFEPLYRIVFMLPVGDSLRAPVKWHHLTEFSLVVLAGYGISLIEARLKGVGASVWPRVLLAAVVLLGAFDLAKNDHLFCAPVDLRQMRRMNCNMQFNVLRRQDFANPQVTELVKRGLIVSVANYLGRPDLYLVEMLTPRKAAPDRKPLPPFTAVTWLGLVSLLGALCVIGYSAYPLCRRIACRDKP